MSVGNGQTGVNGAALRWMNRVLSVEDLRGNLNGQGEIIVAPHTVVTPMALDQLKACGVRIVRQDQQKPAPVSGSGAWGIAQEKPDALVTSAVRSLEREGLRFKSLASRGEQEPCRWARALAECVKSGEFAGGVGFACDPGLICCVANKVKGLRAVAVCSVNQATRAVAGLAANLIIVEMPGRTLFELKQILKRVCCGDVCPPETIAVLQELEDAHR